MATVAYSHRNGESDAPIAKGHYWVKVERLQDWSTEVRFEVWQRGHSRWIDFGDVDEHGAVGGILAIYGPIPQPGDMPPTTPALSSQTVSLAKEALAWFNENYRRDYLMELGETDAQFDERRNTAIAELDALAQNNEAHT